MKKLKGSENYHTWAYAIRELLGLKGYEKYIESEVVDADGVTTGRAAKAVLSLSVERRFLCTYTAVLRQEKYGPHSRAYTRTRTCPVKSVC